MRRLAIRTLWQVLAVTMAAFPAASLAQEPATVAVDLSGFRGGTGEPDTAAIAFRVDGPTLEARWSISPGKSGWLSLNLRRGEPLIQNLGIINAALGGRRSAILAEVDPVTFVTVGTRVAPRGRPPGMSPFNVFFDSPAKRPSQTYQAKLNLRSVKVTGDVHRATVALGGLTIGPFTGELRFHLSKLSSLLQVEAAIQTDQDGLAIVYDAGLVAKKPSWRSAEWRDTDGILQRESVEPGKADRSLEVRHRTIALAGEGGSIACLPPPHQFFYPRDLTDNQRTVWLGKGHRGLEDRDGFGVRQTETGGGGFVPWFNAPPGVEHRLSVFYLLSPGTPSEALDEALKLTRGDRFADIPGHVTLASHWHMATAVAALKELFEGIPRSSPDFVRMFKDMNIDIVHLAEFHGDGHPGDPGPIRLAELKAMFDECRRLSDDEILFLPGEEANVHLGVKAPSQHPGHWLYLFPRPVSWTMTRQPGQPFEENDPERGKVYHVGNAEEMARLIECEHGLAWTAHPRIKASSWAPDAYKEAPYFRARSWLGGAWKAMPADLSRLKLGERVLDLLDDMANWGAKKYVLGEVDVFKLDHAHELFGHMNINYLRLDRAPRYEGDWSPVLDALRDGQFFVTTGEILLPEFRVGGKLSGETLQLPENGRPLLRFKVDGTFPLSFAEVISGDGSKVYRERIDLADRPPGVPFAEERAVDLTGKTWVRLEVWDIAANGAFTQPVWLVR